MWGTVKLGEVATVIAGQSPAGENYNKDGVGTPFMQGKKDYGDKFPNPPTVWTTSVTKLAEKGDILMSVRAPVGALNIANQQVCIGRGLAAIRASEKIELDYLFYALLQISARLEGSSGAIFNSINKKQIEEIEFLLPPLAEQQRIVAKLDAAFAEIDSAVEIARDKIALFVELERKFLQTNFDEKNFDAKDVYSLEQVATFNSGNTPSKKNPDFWNGDFPWISAKDLKFEEIRESIDKITQNAVNCGAAKIAGKGSLLILVRGMGLLNGIAIGELQRDCAFNQDIKALVPKPSLNSRFLLLLLKARFLNLGSYLTSAAHGTAKVEFERIKKTRVVVPPLPQQLEMVELHKGLVKQCQKSLGAAESTVRELSSLKSAILAQELQSEVA